MARKAWLANKDSPSAVGCSSSFAFPLAAAQRLLQRGQPAKLGNKDFFYLLRLLNHGHSCLLGEKSGSSTFHWKSQEWLVLSSRSVHTLVLMCFMEIVKLARAPESAGEGGGNLFSLLWTNRSFKLAYSNRLHRHLIFSKCFNCTS